MMEVLRRLVLTVRWRKSQSRAIARYLAETFANGPTGTLIERYC